MAGFSSGSDDIPVLVIGDRQHLGAAEIKTNPYVFLICDHRSSCQEDEAAVRLGYRLTHGEGAPGRERHLPDELTESRPHAGERINPAGTESPRSPSR